MKVRHPVSFTVLLPPYWQAFASPLARPCQYDGKLLPTGRQSLANKVAKNGKIMS